MKRHAIQLTVYNFSLYFIHLVEEIITYNKMTRIKAIKGHKEIIPCQSVPEQNKICL